LDALLNALFRGELSEAQAVRLAGLGPDAVRLALLAASARFAQLRPPHGVSPSTPSGMVPVHRKPAAGKRRRKRPGARDGHPGHRRKPPPKIDAHAEHRLAVCPWLGLRGQLLTLDTSLRPATLAGMARPLRIEFEGAAYHVTARGNERRAIFRDDADRLRFLETLGQACARFGLVVHGYCLMPNHYHLLCATPRGNLSRAVGWVQAAYAIRHNRRHGRCGHLVQGRFRAHLIEADAYARQLVRYVHLNPVRPRDRRRPVPAERRDAFDAYRWSSHRAYAGTTQQAADEAPPWLSTEWLSYWDDGSGTRGRARRAYVADLAACFGQPIDSPLADLRGGLVLGSDALWQRVQKRIAGGPRAGGAEELKWTRRADQRDAGARLSALLEDEADRRVRIWARAALGGERLSDLARDLGYSDGSGVLRVVQRLEAAAQHDRPIQQRMRALRAEMSSVKS
jgi:REP element-mobilizing transposase RayT